jgi:3-oxoacyl-[acyl-carrier protein] reductase
VSASLNGEVAIVLGGRGKIAQAIAMALHEEGAAIAVHTRHDVAATAPVVEAVERRGGQALAVAADLRQPAQLAEMVERVRTTLGAPTVLVEVAAPKRVETRFEDIGPTTWQEWWEVCVIGPLECVRLMLPDMRLAKFGRVVLVSALAAHVQVHGLVNVAVAKAAMEGAVRALAGELGPDGITVNAIAPGPVDTIAITPEKREMAERSMIGRQSTVDEIASLCRLLCRRDVGNLTGQVIHASGGIYLAH